MRLVTSNKRQKKALKHKWKGFALSGGGEEARPSIVKNGRG